MKKKKQNNIGEFDLCKDEYGLEADLEIEPGYRFYVPWLHREFWEEQDLNQEPNQEQSKENFHLKLKKDSFNRERTERKATI